MGHLAILERLLEHGADVRVVDSGGAGCLHAAVRGGHTDALALLLDSGGDEVLDEPDAQGNVPLHVAAELGRADCARLLLETCATPNLANEKGVTPCVQHPFNLSLFPLSNFSIAPFRSRASAPPLGNLLFAVSESFLCPNRLLAHRAPLVAQVPAGVGQRQRAGGEPFEGVRRRSSRKTRESAAAHPEAGTRSRASSSGASGSSGLGLPCGLPSGAPSLGLAAIPRT